MIAPPMAEVSELLNAVYRGDQSRVDELLGADLELDVFEAAALGRGERVRELLDREPTLARAVSPDGFTALHLAAFFSHDLDSARQLVVAGADPGVPAQNAMAVTPLGSAVARGAHAVAVLLLDAGADVGRAQHGGYTPLHSAGANGDAELVELLLARGADPAAPAEDGRTPAATARERGHPQVAAALEAAAAGRRGACAQG